MRPLKLTLQAFGSYADRFDVDFVRLSQHGIFSITGATGSGKTTIFDAMVFALYGELPGKRHPDDTRSQFAADGTETFVRFEFEVKGTSWVIERRPKQERPKERGTGTRVVQPSATFHEIAKTTGAITNLIEIKSAVAELIGLDHAQFQQVVLLPQGQFEAVLKAETKDRIGILRQLFPVDIYSDFTGFLETELKARQAEYDLAASGTTATTNRIRQSLADALATIPAGVSHDWYTTLFDESSFDVARVPHYLLQLGDVISTIKPRQEAASRAFEAASIEHNQVTSAVTEFEKWSSLQEEAKGFDDAERADQDRTEELGRLQRLAGLAGTLDAHIANVESLADLEQQRERHGQRLEKLWINDYDLSALADEALLKKLVQSAQRDETKLLAASETHQQLVTLRDSLDQLAQERDAIRATCTSLELADQENKAEIERLDGRIRELRAILASESDVKVRLTATEQAFKDLQAREEQQASALALETKLTTAMQKRDKLGASLKKLRIALRDGMAGELAKSLKPNHACPTCGSMEHPKPARASASAPSQEDVDAADAKHAEADKAVRALERQLAKVTGAIAAITATGTVAECEKKLEQIRREDAALSHARDELQTAEEGLAKWRSALEGRKPLLDRAKEQRTECATKLTTETKRFEKESKLFEKSFGSLDDFEFDEPAFSKWLQELETYATLLSDVSAKGKEIAASTRVIEPILVDHAVPTPVELRALILSDEEISQAREEISQRSFYCQGVQEFLRQYEEEQKPTTRPDESVARAKLEAAREESDGIVRVTTKLQHSQDTIASDVANLSENEAQVAQLRTLLEEANAFYSLCVGKKSGNNELKVALDEWVLSEYLKRVLIQANARLRKMTNGRFELNVSSLGGDNRKRHGLDIEVFDAFTGGTRKARTMSGGETFMSALALALGLADVVSAGSNRELDALFIDEGFGSLDEQALDQVLAILDSLHDSGRVIGVISHVEELKRVLPRGIEVVGTDHGSVANVLYPDR